MLDKENVSTLFVGDLPPKLLESMHGVFKGVYAPLVASQQHVKGWTSMLAKEVGEAVEQTAASAYVALGQSRGETLLPEPSLEVFDDGSVIAGSAATAEGLSKGGQKERSSRGSQKERVHVLETAVVTWTSQIKASLSNSLSNSLSKSAQRTYSPRPSRDGHTAHFLPCIYI